MLGHVVKGANTRLKVFRADGTEIDFSHRAEDPAQQAELQAKKLRSFLTHDVGVKFGWVKPLLVFPQESTFDVPRENRDVSRVKFQPFIVTLDEAVEFIRGFRTRGNRGLSREVLDVIVKALRLGPDKLSPEDKMVVGKASAAFSRKARHYHHPFPPFPTYYPPRGYQRDGSFMSLKYAAVSGGIMILFAFLLSVFAFNYQPWKHPDREQKNIPAITSASQDNTMSIDALRETTEAIATSFSTSFPQERLQKTATAREENMESVQETIAASMMSLGPRGQTQVAIMTSLADDAGQIPDTPAPPRNPRPSPTLTGKESLTASPIPTKTPGPGWSASKGGLTLTVQKIERAGNAFRVWMEATNTGKDTLTLPLYMNFFVIDNQGNQYQADPFTSTFPTAVAPGATVSGYALMTPSLDADAANLKAMFATVFGSFAIDSISVENIPVP